MLGGSCTLQESASASPGELAALSSTDEGGAAAEGAGGATPAEPQLSEAASQLTRIVEERLQALVRPTRAHTHDGHACRHHERDKDSVLAPCASQSKGSVGSIVHSM